jgi:carbon-monoxide dehydrogenase small subunit
MLAVSYLEKNSTVDEEEIRDLVASNLCRCTGYQNIVEAIRAVAEKRLR